MDCKNGISHVDVVSGPKNSCVFLFAVLTSNLEIFIKIMF